MVGVGAAVAPLRAAVVLGRGVADGEGDAEGVAAAAAGEGEVGAAAAVSPDQAARVVVAGGFLINGKWEIEKFDSVAGF